MPVPIKNSKLIDVSNLRSIEIDSFDPPQLQVSATYGDESVRGRSQPYRFYSDTGFRTWSMTIHLVASLQQADGGTVENVEEAIRFIMSFAYPEYRRDFGVDGGYTGPPHLAHLVLGNFMDSKGYVGEPSAQLGPVYYDDRPMSADITFTFDELFDRAPSLDEIYSGGMVKRF
jgi:hypothetical protein